MVWRRSPAPPGLQKDSAEHLPRVLSLRYLVWREAPVQGPWAQGGTSFSYSVPHHPEVQFERLGALMQEVGRVGSESWVCGKTAHSVGAGAQGLQMLCASERAQNAQEPSAVLSERPE